MIMSCCMCEAVDTAQSQGDESHGQRGRESTDHTQGAAPRAEWMRAWPVDRCSLKDAGRSERKTPTLVNVNRQQLHHRQVSPQVTPQLHVWFSKRLRLGTSLPIMEPLGVARR